jgi:hypothetical protein
VSIDESDAMSLEHGHRELRAALQRLAFPADHDDVLAELADHLASAELVARVRALAPVAPYRSLDDLCDDLDGYPPGRTPPPWA